MQEQNIYDNPIFFGKYKELRANEASLNNVMEIPAMRSLLPDLTGKTILDLGSGFGDFARYAIKMGAKKVYGIELSSKMIERAKSLSDDERIVYIHTSMTDIPTFETSFDLIVSSLAIHYIENFNLLANNLYSLLKEGGKFIFSIEHPMCTAVSSSYLKNEQGEFIYLPVDNYQDESIRHTKWFVDDVIKHHRTIDSYVSGLLAAGFTLKALKEPKIVPAELEKQPEMRLFQRYSPFLVFSVER